MAKAEEVTRIYSGSDADMLQVSRVMQGLFTEDKTAFTEFDTAFADPFAGNWMQQIETASNFSQDTIALGEQTELTKIVAEKMEECKKFFQSMKYFVEKAFPGKKEIWAQFGYSDYEYARRGETKMVQFLGVLSKTALTYKDQLIEAGFTQEKIDQIAVLQSDLTQADYNQEIAKKGRPALTQERITNLNHCYGYMQKVSKAGKIIFDDDFVKYNQYLLPNDSAAKKEEPQAPAPPGN